MPYYRGDYYRGDYYRGDVWGTLKKIGKAVVDPKGYVEGQLFGGGPKPKAASGPPAAPAGGIDFSGRAIKKVFGFGGGPAAAAGHMKKRRHMNPLNVKALRRADRRARSFLRITKSVVKHYVPKQPKGRSYIHSKARKRA